MTGDDLPAAARLGAGAKPELRASHEDRDRVVEILRVAGGDGRLTAAELDERLGADLTARTSAQVRRLESELGQQLLDRSGRSVRLTEVGSAVLPFARAALEAVANARMAVDELSGLVRGQVVVGMVSGCALPVLAELLAGFHDLYPGVSITLTEDNSDRLVGLLRDGQLDLALIGSAAEAAPGVEAAVVTDEELVAAVDSGHPLAGSGAITLGALRDVPLVSLPRGTGVRAALDAACAEAGFTPRIVFEASALPMVVHMAARGLGLAVVPASTANAPQILQTRILQITSPRIGSRLELA